MAHDPVGDLGFDFATVCLGATILAVAALQTSWGPMGDPELLDRLGAWTEVEGWWQPWRLLSCTWLHASPAHLASNLVALAIYGWPLERAIGWRRLLLFYVFAGLAGSVVGVGLERPIRLVGASGAIFGLYGAMAAMAVAPRRMLHAGELSVLREALWPVGLVQVVMSFQPGVSWGAHLGGLLVGVLAGATGLLVAGLPPRAPDPEPVPPIAWGRAVVTTALVGLLACGCQPVMSALLLAYVLIVGLVAWAEPRYSAPDGWVVTAAAVLAAVALWGTGGLAMAVGRPWELGSDTDLAPQAPIEAPVPDAVFRPSPH